MSRFVPDTDPELRARLTACHLAEDPRPAMAVLAEWLAARGDSRAEGVRMGTEYWAAVHIEPDRTAAPEFAALERRMDADGLAIVRAWLGARRRGDGIAVDWHRPLLCVYVDEFDGFRRKLLGALRAGWVWDLVIRCGQIEEVLDALLTDPGPVREVSFDGNESLRNGDLERLAALPGLHEVDLSRTRVSDAGLRHLHAIPTLRSVFLEDTPRVTEDGVAALRGALHGCRVRRL